MTSAIHRSARSLLLLGLIGGVTACGGPSGERAGPRHVVLVSLDTARADHFGFLGNTEVRTPRLDELAAESIVFTDFMTVAPTTLASHTSLFTGKYPHHHGTPRNGFTVNPANEMLPEILKAAGFHTAGFAGSFALDSRFGFAQGIDHYDEEFSLLVGQGGADQNQRSAAEVTDAVIRYLDETGVPDRLFLFAHYFDPHRPYAAPPPFDKAYDPLGASGLPDMGELMQQTEMTAAEQERYARRYELQYAAEISYLDHHLGRLLDDLRRRSILEDSLLVLTSDHGENLWDHAMRFDHGFTVYQSTMRSVCVIRLPRGEMAGTRVNQLVASIDVLPTILRYLGLDVPSPVDGEPIDLLATDGPLPARTRFGQATKPFRGVENDPRWTNMRKARFIRDGRFKLIRVPFLGTEELYDLESDPGETANLLENPGPESQAVARRLRAALEQWAASARPLPSEFDRSQEEDTVRRLRSLGYLN